LWEITGLEALLKLCKSKAFWLEQLSLQMLSYGAHRLLALSGIQGH